MGKSIPWHGKMSKEENVCPHCGSNDYSDVSVNVMELSAQFYKVCTKCQGKFVDTYLVDFGDDYESESNWSKQEGWEETDQQEEIFKGLSESGWLSYDEENPNKDSDYYDIPTQSINFIKGEDDG